jgi:hypothetical protein
MPRRVIAFLLAVVLLWSGLSTLEAPSASAPEGSVEQHHLDDLPLQAQNDPSTEGPGLLPAPLTATAPLLVVAQRHVFVSTAAGPPYLAGPLRPPCSDAISG